MDPVGNFLHYNTSTLGHIFVNPEELQPCKHTVESIARRMNSGKCPVCQIAFTGVTPLPDRKQQIAEFVERNKDTLERTYALAVTHVVAMETSLKPPPLNLSDANSGLVRFDREGAHQIALQQANREKWTIQALVLLVLAYLWWYDYIDPLSPFRVN